jgi:hypothetical protein
MENQADRQQLYEKQLVFHLLIFRKAMQQYASWGKRAVASEVLRSDPRYETTMRQLIEAMALCAQQFQALPEPPEGGREVNQLIQNLGKEMGQFTQCFETLLIATDPSERETLTTALAIKSRAMKQSYRQFGSQYDQIFPGRLDMMLQSLQNEMATEL